MAETVNPLPRDRIRSLDSIRGVAVMGIFSVNVTAFAMIFPAYMNPVAYGGHTGENLATWLANYVIIDGKMRSLFSMLFGASMLLVIDRAQAAGQSPARVHYARMAVLLLLGLFHFYFIWHGDILVLYALTAMIAFLFRECAARTMAIWAGVLMLITSLVFSSASYGMQQTDIAAHRADATAKDVKRWNDMASFANKPAAANAEETRLALSPASTRAEHMLADRIADPFGAAIPFFLPTLGLMLAGMAGYRSGFLTGAWDDRRYQRIAVWTLTIGAATTLALASWVISSGFYVPLLFLAFFGLGGSLQLAMAVGYAALIILATRRSGALSDRVAAVGRAAFTNYLGTSIVAALIFYGDGLALFGKLSRFEAWLVVPLMWALMLLWSKPWLDRFHYGPLEWLWRSLARGRLQPLRKHDLVPASA